jgi:toxin ParE1/3/4
MSDYLLSEEAKEDIERIYKYGFLTFGEQQADTYYLGFFDAFEKIAANPLHYESIDGIRFGYRKCSYGSDTIYYRIRNEHVEIMSILGGQDNDSWL